MVRVCSERRSITMATVDEVRAAQGVWQDKHVIVKLNNGQSVRGRLVPSIGAFYVGDKYVEEKDIVSIELT
jgi:hypothetical protein